MLSCNGCVTDDRLVFCVWKLYQRLNVGDMIRFGASTRMYVVNGPDGMLPVEHDSDNMQKYRESLKAKSMQAAATEEEGVSWGMDDDAVQAEEPDDDDVSQLHVTHCLDCPHLTPNVKPIRTFRSTNFPIT